MMRCRSSGEVNGGSHRFRIEAVADGRRVAAASIALTLGLYSRVAALVVFVGVVSFQQRNSLIDNSGDLLIRNLAFFCVLAPTGVALSVDRLRRSRETFWEFPARAPWVLRLVQIELSVGYLSAVWHKVQGAAWRDGTAVAYALRMSDLQRMAAPEVVARSVVLTEALTFGTLALELALGVLVWNRAARPWVMSLGIVMHVMIDSVLVVGFFTFAMLVAYLAFLAPATARRWILGAATWAGWRLDADRPRVEADSGPR